MSAWLAWRLVKWVAVMLFAAGILGGVGASSLGDRRRAAYALAAPGFVLLWLSGWALARETGASLGAPWISVGLLASLIALQAVVWGVERARAPAARRLVAVAALASLLVGTGFMVARPGHAVEVSP